MGIPLCNNRFPITGDGGTLYLPYCSNQSIDTANTAIVRVIFAIHGADPIAQSYLDSTLESARMVSPHVEDETLIIAPQFIKYSEYTDGEIDGTISNDVLLWTGWRFVGWRSHSKNASDEEQPFRISSFTVMDEMLRHIITHENFPNLRRIVILGQSGGGQFVNRFAASSRFEPLLALPAGITVRYIVMNPGSYMYFSDKRVRPRSQRPRYEFDFDFETPSDHTIDEAIAFCASLTGNDCGSRNECRNQYNRYGWGTEGLLDWDYHRNLSLSAEEMAEQYCNRNVVYLVGSEDRIIGSDIRHTGLSCGDILQGKDRLERAVIYFAHLKNELGCSIERRHVIDIVPGVGHGGRPIIKSKLGRQYIFEEFEEVILPRYEDLERVDGKLTQVQARYVGGRMQIRCRLKRSHESDPEGFFNYADDEGGRIALKQLDLLRDALARGLHVRLMFEDRSDYWKRFYDVRIYDEVLW